MPSSSSRILAAALLASAACGEVVEGPALCQDACANLYETCELALVPLGTDDSVDRQGCVDACVKEEPEPFRCLSDLTCSGDVSTRETAANRCLSGETCEAAELRILDCYGEAASAGLGDRCIADPLGARSCVDCISSRTCAAIVGTCDAACGVQP